MARPSIVPASAPMPCRGLSREHAAHYLGISASKFDQLVKQKRMPSPRLIDRRKVWDVRDLDLAFEELPREDASETAGNSWEDR
jgi:excisionase family DNA binding protein